MSNKGDLLDLTDQPGLLFHPGPSSTLSVAEGRAAEDGHPNDMAPSQEPLQSDATPMSPSEQGTVYCHHPATSSLGAPRWNSHEMNQWPNRLFTTAPPTPSGGSTLPLVSFRVPPKQQDLEDSQNSSQPPPVDPTPRFIDQLSPINLQIYNNCRGNRANLWPLIAEEIYNLQARYGELIIFVPGSERNPRYTCGVCSHPTTTNPVHTKPKRRWDSSPDILSHGAHQIKPWFSNCGTAFPRHRDQRRHSARCQMCQAGHRSCASPVQHSSASSPTLSPRLSLPVLPLYNTTPQELVMPRSGGHPALPQSNMFTVHELAPYNYAPWQQSSDPQWARQALPYYPTQGPCAQSYYEPYPRYGMANALSQYTYTPAVNHLGENSYPSHCHIDFGTSSQGMAPLVYPGHLNDSSYIGCPPTMPVPRETVSSILPPAPVQFGVSGPHQDSWVKDGSHSYGEKVRTNANVSGMPAEQYCVESLEGRGKRIERSHRLTAAFLILLILSVLFWFFVRYFLYP